MPSHPDPFGEDQQAEIEESRARAIRQDAEKQAALRLLDREVCEKYRVLGDKVLVRLVDDSLTVSSGGIFLTSENSQVERGVVVALGAWKKSNAFVEPIMRKIGELMDAYDRVEVLIAKARQDAHEYQYSGQKYLFIPCVFLLACEPVLTPSPTISLCRQLDRCQETQEQKENNLETENP